MTILRIPYDAAKVAFTEKWESPELIRNYESDREFFHNFVENNPFYDGTDEPFLIIIQLDKDPDDGYPSEAVLLFEHDHLKNAKIKLDFTKGPVISELEVLPEVADEGFAFNVHSQFYFKGEWYDIPDEVVEEMKEYVVSTFIKTMMVLGAILSEEKVYFDRMDRASRRRIQREHNTDKQDKYLVLSLNQKTYASGESLPSGHRKRYHFVRGHTRTYQNGHTVWIKPYWRGDDELGVIMKDYAA
jgi:hypothetical protein